MMDTYTQQPQLVFAYGSNLNVAQMKSRVPGCKSLGVATLPGNSMAFVGHSRAWGGGVATIEEMPETIVEGVVWLLPAYGILWLDLYEGTASQAYTRQVETAHIHGTVADVWVYRASARYLTPPSKRYLKTILDGAQHHGIDPQGVLSAYDRARKAEAVWPNTYSPSPWATITRGVEHRTWTAPEIKHPVTKHIPAPARSPDVYRGRNVTAGAQIALPFPKTP